MPTATPYWSGIPIDAIAPSTDADDSPAQIQCKEAYQSLIGSIGWLAMSTRPDLSAVHFSCPPTAINLRRVSHESSTIRVTLHPFYF